LRKDANDRPVDMREVRRELTEAAAGRVSGRSADGAREKSIAVLPFNNLSGSDDEFFADGITEEILNALAQLEGLRVAARSSCFAFKGRREDPRTVAERLDVTTVLEGSVRRAGDRLRITAQLVNGADGYQLWSERYDRELTDVFQVQDEIAASIATKLRGTLTGDADRARARRGTTSIEAYELFLKGRALLLQRGRFILEAVTCLEQALSLDPDYADVLAALSDGYRLLATFGAASASDAMPRARAAAERALAIQPELSEALATLADIEAQYHRDIVRAGAVWERALAADSHNIRARCERPLFMFAFGAWTVEQSVDAVRRATADEPLNAWAAGIHGLLLGFAGRNAEAIAESRRAVSLDPGSFFAQMGLLRSLCWAGDHERAFEMAPALLASSGRHQWALGTLARAYAKAGRTEVARAIHDELDARSRMEFIAPFWRAAAAWWAGLPDEALAHAERALQDRDPMAVYLNVMPEWEGFRGHPHFPRLRTML
jgi:serine/threonine-protein kinase